MGYQGMYDTKWDGQSTHQCSSRHQKQTMVEAIGLNLTTHWEANPLPHDVVLWAHLLFFRLNASTI